MASPALITLDFADSVHDFALKIGQIGELERLCEAGAPVLLRNLHNGEWCTRDVTEVIRLGLIGAGLSPSEALRIVRTYVHERPWAMSVPVAQAILAAAIVGVPTASETTAGEPQPVMAG